ncbi:hypothetical protein MMC13_006337 [Lambiella insularis]|nr:hypothetical protein [Lambiella insularis]
MTQERTLPKKRNPLLAPERTPEHAELISRRRLGQTNLTVKPSHVGISNATKPENLGMFDYAHLRAPLPENLKTSEIFAPQPKQPHPEAYFLMRRSTDGYVSATGMFKVSFPWAKTAEEFAERDYLRSLPSTGQDEVAGNIWIPEAFGEASTPLLQLFVCSMVVLILSALELAEEYGILPWIQALLDDTPVEATDDKKSISPPPKFVFTANNDKTTLPPPGNTPARGRGRPRASSPTKVGPGNKHMTPRKSRPSKASKEANAASAREASASLQAALDSAASRADTESVDDGKSDGEKYDDEKADEEKVTVQVDSTIEVNGDTEVTNTKVRVQMPLGSPDLPMPETTEDMIIRAKEMVEEARKLEGESSRSSTKRKVDELDDEDDEDMDDQLLPAKKSRLLEQELKKQRVRKRALIGVATTLAIGAVVPYLIGA